MSAVKRKGAGLSEDREAVKARAKSPPAQEPKQEPPGGKEAKMWVRPARVEKMAQAALEARAACMKEGDMDPGAYKVLEDRFRRAASREQVQRYDGLLKDPDWKYGSMPVEAATRLVCHGRDWRPRREEDVGPDEGRAAERAQKLDLRGAVELLGALPAFPQPRDGPVVILWCAHTCIYKFLPACCHLLFSGPSGSGKSRALRTVLAIVRGEFVTDASEAYVTRVLDAGAVLGFDEVDAQLRAHKDGMLESILRQATDPKARRRILDPTEDHEWIPRELDLYRPCVFTCKSDLEKALMTRTLQIRMEPHADAARIVRNLYPDEICAALRIWLHDLAEEVQKKWTPEKVHDLMADEEFLHMLDEHKRLLPRDKELAALLLATAVMFGWQKELEPSILACLQEAAEERTTDEEVMVLDALRAVTWQEGIDKSGPRWVYQEEVLSCLNDHRKCLNLRPVDPRRLGRLLSDLGFRDKVERIKVSAEGGKRRIVETDLVKDLLFPSSPSKGGLGTLGTHGTSRQASLAEAAVPSVPCVPRGGSIEAEEAAIVNRELYDSARRRMFERSGETEDWYVQDLVLAHQISEKDRPAVKEIVHRAYLISLRERTPPPAEGSEEISADRAEGPAGKEEQTRRPPSIEAFVEQVVEPGEHLPPEEPGKDGPPPEISEKLAMLKQTFPQPLVKWAIRRALEMRSRGDVWTAYHLRSEGKRELPDLSHEVALLADEHFSDLLTITDYLYDRKKHESPPSSPQPGEAQPAPAAVAKASQSEGFKGGPQRQPEKGGPPP